MLKIEQCWQVVSTVQFWIVGFDMMSSALFTIRDLNWPIKNPLKAGLLNNLLRVN